MEYLLWVLWNKIDHIISRPQYNIVKVTTGMVICDDDHVLPVQQQLWDHPLN